MREKFQQMFSRSGDKSDEDVFEDPVSPQLSQPGDHENKRDVQLLRLKMRDEPPLAQNEQWKQDIQELADRIPPQDLTHPILRVFEKHKIRVGKGVSFHHYMVEDSEIRKMGLKSLSWELNRKTTAYRFVDSLGVRRPEADLEPTTFKKVSWRVPGVLKAASGTGGRGTYLLLAEDEIVHVFDGKKFSSQEEMGRHASDLMKRSNRRRTTNRWIMEELILESSGDLVPARDVKFFSFYGEVLFILEVIRRGPETQYSFTRPDGSPVRPGGWDYTYFDGAGPTAEGLELATRISKQIPHPFMRIDMLKSEGDLVFGEFTPRPGGFHRFNTEWDRKMGEAWARAQERLQRDLLNGKRFDAFLSATGVYSPSSS